MIRCVIIDDEPMARSLLIDYCKRVPSLHLVDEFSNGFSALDFLKKNEIDLIFLDIKMPDLTGLDLIRILDQRAKVILTTAFPEYALDGFELDVVDYLLKPFDFSRFLKAINKASNYLESGSVAASVRDYLFIKDGRDLIKVHYANLQYIKGAGDYVTFCLEDKKIMTLMTLKELEIELPGDRFVRIHQSYIVNKGWIQRVSGDKVEVAGTFLPISRTYKKLFGAFIKGI